MGREHDIAGERGENISYRAVPLPHDCAPTVAYSIEHGGRRIVILTDMGTPREDVAAALAGADVLLLEFNYDDEMLREGPYSDALKRRISGGQGHLENRQAARMLEKMVGPRTHTVVLTHLSLQNNTPDLACAAAKETLARLGRPDIEILIASQHEVGPTIEV